jgi:hypothetical protein
VNIPEATISFVQGGTSASCVIVRFSAGICAPGGGVYVRAFLDQTTAALPIDINYASNDACFQAHAFEFIFPSVAPGVHTVRMQYRSLSGTIVYVARHNTVVQFAP